jgi:hypothetical protein
MMFSLNFIPGIFFIKDRATRNLLLEGKCESGLYPIKPSDVEFIKQAFLSYSARPENGMPSSAIHPLKSSAPFCVFIIFRVSRRPVHHQFVMRVS